MTNEKFKNILTELQEALIQGMIYNPDFKRLKDAANWLFEMERNGVMQGVFLSTQNRTAADRELYYEAPSSLHVLNSKKAQKVLKAAQGSELAKAVEVLIARWAPVARLLNTLKPLIMKGRKPSTGSSTGKVRTLDNTGTCACCGRNIKLDGSWIVDHGYQVSWGFGGRRGSCFGVHLPPIEVSDEGLRAKLRAVQNSKERIVEQIADVVAGTARVFEEDYVVGKGRVQIELQPEDRRYAPKRDLMLRDLEIALQRIDTEIERTTTAIKTWEPTRLPDETPEAFQARRGAQ